MPTLTLNADLSPHQGGPHVHVFIDGKRVGGMGPFADWHQAQRAALELTDDVHAAVLIIMKAHLEKNQQD